MLLISESPHDWGLGVEFLSLFFGGGLKSIHLIESFDGVTVPSRCGAIHLQKQRAAGGYIAGRECLFKSIY